MRRLTFSADYYGVAIGELDEGPIHIDDLDLPNELRRDILAWQDEYDGLLPRDESWLSGASLARVVVLDERGLELAARIAAALSDGSTVQYYSRGRTRFLSSPQGPSSAAP